MEPPEDEFAAAINSGDLAAIDAASKKVLDPPSTIPTLLASALWYAERGLRVFPLTPGTKIPFKGSNGCKSATAELATIRSWWETYPDANIGIATGHLIDVVDIDGFEGQRSRVEHWDEIFGRVEDDCLGKVLTPRQGGFHIYVPATGDGNRAGIVLGVDYRGAGGYVVAPPSVVPEGNYRWLGTPTLDGLGARVAG